MSPSSSPSSSRSSVCAGWTSLACALACALAWPPAPAFAAGPPKAAAGSPKAAAPLAQSLSGPAKDAYVSAQILLNNGDFAGAQRKYSQAYDISKDPRLLFNMAVCARSLRAYARMQSLLKRYLAEATAMSSEDRADVDNALAAIRNLVGTVRLVVTEPGADVAVDGDPVGATPLANPIVIDLGAHRVSVAKTGFKTTEQAIDVQGGAEVAVTISLVSLRHLAQLVVSSDDDATVIVDDKLPAKGRFDAQIASGVHDVRVSEPGRVTYRAQVDLKDGETRTLQVTLESEKHGTAWPWIVGGAAVVAGAVVGGYFLFKPSPEGSAPVTGTFATVQLNSFGGR